MNYGKYLRKKTSLSAFCFALDLFIFMKDKKMQTHCQTIVKQLN